MRAFVERKQLEMALGPGIVCQQLPNRTMVPCWRLLEKRAEHVTHIKETVLSLEVVQWPLWVTLLSVLCLDECLLTSWTLLFMSVINFMELRVIKFPLIISSE